MKMKTVSSLPAISSLLQCCSEYERTAYHCALEKILDLTKH